MIVFFFKLKNSLKGLALFFNSLKIFVKHKVGNRRLKLGKIMMVAMEIRILMETYWGIINEHENL